MSYLQEALDMIEAKAATKSAMVCAGADAIEAAYSLRDRLIKQEDFEPIVTLHYHMDELLISIHTNDHKEDMLRVALAALDIETPEQAGEVQYTKNVRISFNHPVQWRALKEAA